MTSPVDICNRALSEVGARASINSLTDATAAANACRTHYNTLRKQLLRTAPWGFCRKTAALSLTGSLDAGTAPYPWLYRYGYPADCLKVRYVLPPPPVFNGAAPVVGDPVYFAPWCGPNRSNRFLVAVDDSTGVEDKQVLSNIQYALIVYNKDSQSPDIWDDLFQNAFVAALANKICLQVTGNAGMKQGLMQVCEDAIIKARVADGNEAIPTTDHTPDWITTRGVASPFGWAPGYQAWQGDSYGQWYGQWDNMSWGA